MERSIRRINLWAINWEHFHDYLMIATYMHRFSLDEGNIDYKCLNVEHVSPFRLYPPPTNFAKKPSNVFDALG